MASDFFLVFLNYFAESINHTYKSQPANVSFDFLLQQPKPVC